GHLASAGRRALARDDLALAAGLLGRALERLAPDSSARPELVLDWCETLLAAGDVGPAERALDELARVAGDSARLRAWHVCFAAHLAALTDPQALGDTADAVAAAAQRLAAEGDAAGEAKAHSVHALVLSRLGRIGACEGALDLALAAARRGRDRRRSNAVLAGAPLAALWGPSPVTRASGRCLDVVRVLRITQGAPAVEAVALRCQGVLEALRGRADAARRMVASSRRLVEELGITQRLLEAELFAGRIELLEGDFAAAERCLRTAYDGLRAQGLDIDAAQAAALLGRALLAQGRGAEAEALSRESAELAGDDRIAGIAWRCVRAEALAQRGEHAAAIEIAGRAVELGAATDALLDHADARTALATALRAAGRAAEADAEETRAVALWEAKGATLLVERARAGARHAEPRGRAAEAAPAFVRRVRENAATAAARSIEAAVRRRDGDALAARFGTVVEAVEHATAATFDGRALAATWRTLVGAQDPALSQEILATLGDSLALIRGSMRMSEIREGPARDFGPVQREELVLIEVDAEGNQRRLELFAPNGLGDAIVRLYARYAELQPEGPAREQAAAAARSFASMLPAPGPFDPARARPHLSDDLVVVDHRKVGFGTRGDREAYLRVTASVRDVADELVERCDDVLALRPDGLLVRRTLVGTSRTSGGPFESSSWSLFLLGGAGRIARGEFFPVEQQAEALARFEALTGGAAPPKPSRRVRANAATRVAARIDAAIAAKDASAVADLHAEDLRVVHHLTGTELDREGALATIRIALRAQDVRSVQEPLAVLGESLALFRVTTSVGALAEGDVAVGGFETSFFNVVEADAQGCQRRLESFADDHLADALTRLYELHAAELPDGPARERAANAARVVAVLFGTFDLERCAEVLAPDVEAMDLRRVGLGVGRGAAAMLRGLRTALEISDGLAGGVDDVLEATPDGVLIRWTSGGRDRDGGGAFEWQFLRLCEFGADGLLARYAIFDPEREADARARFEALTHEAPARPARVRANAASAFAGRLDAAVASNDVAALRELFAEGMQVTHHPTDTRFGRDGALQRFESLMRADGLRLFHEPLATLGDSLVLCRARTSVQALADDDVAPAGPIDVETRVVIEVDAQGRELGVEIFASDRLADAIACLYGRFAAQLPEGPQRERAAATARSVANLMAPLDVERYAAALAPDVEYVDHRRVGLGSVRGAAGLLRGARTLMETASDFGTRIDGVLDLRPDALLTHGVHFGSAGGGAGAYETHVLQLWRFGADGLLVRLDEYDDDRDADALARFDALDLDDLDAACAELDARDAAEPASPRIGNLATRAEERACEASAAGDWDRFAALFSPHFRSSDRRHLMRLELDRDQLLEPIRPIFEMGLRRTYRVLATRGERLALVGVRLEGSDAASGPSEVEFIQVLEVDDRGLRIGAVGFDAEDVEAAYAELDRSFAAQ
ncbi:MAG TPA: hypothetical protein VFY49_05395, partial [Myxococcota bacterium]|nr:hypothetical protein [Myxococcota bacterium]